MRYTSGDTNCRHRMSRLKRDCDVLSTNTDASFGGNKHGEVQYTGNSILKLGQRCLQDYNAALLCDGEQRI